MLCGTPSPCLPPPPPLQGLPDGADQGAGGPGRGRLPTRGPAAVCGGGLQKGGARHSTLRAGPLPRLRAWLACLTISRPPTPPHPTPTPTRTWSWLSGCRAWPGARGAAPRSWRWRGCWPRGPTWCPSRVSECQAARPDASRRLQQAPCEWEVHGRYWRLLRGGSWGRCRRAFCLTGEGKGQLRRSEPVRLSSECRHAAGQVLGGESGGCPGAAEPGGSAGAGGGVPAPAGGWVGWGGWVGGACCGGWTPGAAGHWRGVFARQRGAGACCGEALSFSHQTGCVKACRRDVCPGQQPAVLVIRKGRCCSGRGQLARAGSSLPRHARVAQADCCPALLHGIPLQVVGTRYGAQMAHSTFHYGSAQK